MKKQSLPLVSVIMPVYNAGRFLVPAIESILHQTYQNIEFIIVDDGSSDGSWELIKTYRMRHPKTIRVFRTEKKVNAAGNGATNFGLTYAKGEYIARMDADDISYPTRIATQVEYMESHPGTILVGSQATIIDGVGKIIGKKTVPTQNTDIYRSYAIVHPIIHPSVMVRRSLLPNRDKLYAMRFDVNDDYYSFFRLLSHGMFANIEIPLIKYRVHGKNLSLSDAKGTILRSVAIRFEAMKNLHYDMPILAFPILLGQWALGFFFPNFFIRSIYGVLRGMTRPHIDVRMIKKRLLKKTVILKFSLLHLIPRFTHGVSYTGIKDK